MKKAFAETKLCWPTNEDISNFSVDHKKSTFTKRSENDKKLFFSPDFFIIPVSIRLQGKWVKSSQVKIWRTDEDGFESASAKNDSQVKKVGGEIEKKDKKPF